MNWNRVFVVGAGGFLGAALRYLVSGATTKYFGDFPIGTLIVNVAGGFIMGLIMEASVSLWPVPANMRIFLTTGILGGLTTFSTFSYETIAYISDGRYLMGGMNAGLNLILSLLACWVGRSVVLMCKARLI